jgi:hypothetical protein
LTLRYPSFLTRSFPKSLSLDSRWVSQRLVSSLSILLSCVLFPCASSTRAVPPDCPASRRIMSPTANRGSDFRSLLGPGSLSRSIRRRLSTPNSRSSESPSHDPDSPESDPDGLADSCVVVECADTSLDRVASPPPANGTPVASVSDASRPSSTSGSPFVERSNPMGSGNAQTVTSKDPKAVAQAATDMKNVVRRKLTGYVGFANLPNQWHRKSVRKGFNFNVMVVGESTPPPRIVRRGQD